MNLDVTTERKTLDQRRAEHAWNVVQSIIEKYVDDVDGKRVPRDEAKKFGIQAKQLPTRIMTSGLGQASAFLLAKRYAPDLLEGIADWVLVRRPNSPGEAEKPEGRTLLEQIVNKDSTFLRRATDETLAYLVWLNRFAEAEQLTEEA